MANENSLRLAVVDPWELYRVGMGGLLMDWPHGKVIFEAEDSLAYRDMSTGEAPIDIALVALRPSVGEGLTHIQWLRDNGPGTKVIAYVNEVDEKLVGPAMDLGACTVLPISVSRPELHNALDQVRLTGHYLSRIMVRDYISAPTPGGALGLRKRSTKP